MIHLSHVSKQYPNTTAVDDISFEVKEGETVALLGTSGCGKTTTLRMINRLAEPTSGTIKVNGEDIAQQPAEALRRGIGYVLQHHGLFPHYTVEENIAIVPNLLKWDKQKTKTRTAELLDKLRLPADILQHYPAQLSGGQQQRIGLARALAAYQPVLLMDEPLGALDPVTRTEIRREFLQLDELKRKTIVIVTHDVQEAFELADKICVMNKGRIVQFGTATDLLFKPADDFVTSFLKEQQLQLELENILVKDVFALLPQHDGSGSTSLLSQDENLWTALETLSRSDEKQFAVQVNNETKQLTTALLMQAFTHYKSNIAK